MEEYNAIILGTVFISSALVFKLSMYWVSIVLILFTIYWLYVSMNNDIDSYNNTSDIIYMNRTGGECNKVQLGVNNVGPNIPNIDLPVYKTDTCVMDNFLQMRLDNFYQDYSKNAFNLKTGDDLLFDKTFENGKKNKQAMDIRTRMNSTNSKNQILQNSKKYLYILIYIKNLIIFGFI